MSITLSPSQQQITQQIIDYGVAHGFSAAEIGIAIKTAYIESSLGSNIGTPTATVDNPNPTASGLYQYTNSSWNTFHSDLGDKNNSDNQISAFYRDLMTYSDWYNNPTLNGNIPRDQIDFGEYVYIKHHDGRSFQDFLNAPGLTYWDASGFDNEVLPSLLHLIWDSLINFIISPAHGEDIDPTTNTLFNAAFGWRQPRYDPLTLDLDGDGLETVGINPSNPILFDHDGDGIKTGTGWVKPDDGFLVHDRDGNGAIDSGREMFGDATPLAGGGFAADGFAALVEEDTNADGRVDALDARFAQLRIWRDLNQNGISEAGELTTLDAAGIVAIRTAKTEHSAMLAKGNQVADKGAYVRADGTEGALVEVTGALADINLAENPFYSEFMDAVAVRGSDGWVQRNEIDQFPRSRLSVWLARTPGMALAQAA